MTLPFSIDCRPPFLVASFFEPQQMLSWSVSHPGMRVARRVAWIEVRDSDLTEHTDAIALVAQRMAAADLDDAITLITSRDIRRHHTTQSIVEDETATCLTTVGLSNGERVGTRSTTPAHVAGTINTLVHIARPLSEAALIETMSIAVQARTAAVLDAHITRNGLAVTGTGTDCIVVAAPCGRDGARFAGLHTAIGEAVGAATYKATSTGIATWNADVEAFGYPSPVKRRG